MVKKKAMAITFIQMGMSTKDNGWRIRKMEEECINIY